MNYNELIGKTNDQLNFIKFLTDKGLIDYFLAESTTTRHPKGQYNNHLPIPIDEKKEMVSYFYGKAFGVLEGINVFAMMHGLRKKYDVKVIARNGKSGVEVNEHNKTIQGKIHTTPTIQGFETIAHEIGHVLTGRNNKKIALLNKTANAKTQQECEFFEREYEGLCREKCNCKYDCIGEIETISIEKLFLMFLSEDEKCRKVLKSHDFNIDEYLTEYEKEHENNAYDNMQKIVETKQLLDKYNITDYFRNEKEFETFLSQLPSDSAREEFKRDMEQITKDNAKYYFRYVTGEAISKYWFDKFKVADKKERKELRDKFTEFWHGTDKLDIEQASALLCDGKTLEEVVSTYFEQTQIYKNNSCKSI
ncbi:MAG: hypothetical protein J6Q13_00340 [Clostridia bacterium]|nr:hypothetical protein [Clostridia bacterium]